MKLFVAPLQGYTDAPYRHFHAEIFGGADAYFSPFVRVENNAPRARDMRNVCSQLNDNHTIVPQIIFGDAQEFNLLTESVIKAGHRHIDLNMGCPFPPQVRHGRGAGVIANRCLLEKLAPLMTRYPEVTFSAKMRLGIKEPTEWRAIIDCINALPLRHITVHPRTAAQQYSGRPNTDELSVFAEQSAHPIVVNGDIMTPDDISRTDAFGVMAGRGLLARPSLFAEYRSGNKMPREERIARLIRMHDALSDYYRNRLCGDSQMLSKIKPFWDYLEPEIGHKIHKAIRKAGTVQSYLAAVRSIR